MSTILKFSDDTWLPELFHAISKDSMRIMRNELVTADILSQSELDKRDEEIESIIDRLASMMQKRGKEFVEVEQEKHGTL